MDAYLFYKKVFLFYVVQRFSFQSGVAKAYSGNPTFACCVRQHIDLEKLSRESDFGIPHFVYNVPLNTLLKDAALPRSPVALRVLQLKKDAPVAYYDLGLDEQNPKLFR